MKTFILLVVVTICITIVAVVFIFSFFKHLDSSGFFFKEQVVKDINALLEFQTKTNRTLYCFEQDMKAMSERINKLEYIVGIEDHEQK